MKSNIFGKVSLKTTILGSLFLLNSCAGMMKYHPYARNVKKKPSRSGVVALKLEHRKEDRDLAKSMMKENCGSKKVKVLDEGEVVIGTITNSNTQKNKGSSSKFGSLFGVPLTSSSPESTNQSSTTTQKKEWQLTYKCSLKG